MTCQCRVKNKDLSLEILNLSISSTRLVVVTKCVHWINTADLKVPVGELPNA